MYALTTRAEQSPLTSFPTRPSACWPQVLPVYALTTAAGSHSAASVIQHALRKNIKPDLARWGGD